MTELVPTQPSNMWTVSFFSVLWFGSSIWLTDCVSSTARWMCSSTPSWSPSFRLCSSACSICSILSWPTSQTPSTTCGNSFLSYPSPQPWSWFSSAGKPLSHSKGRAHYSGQVSRRERRKAHWCLETFLSPPSLRLPHLLCYLSNYHDCQTTWRRRSLLGSIHNWPHLLHWLWIWFHLSGNSADWENQADFSWPIPLSQVQGKSVTLTSDHHSNSTQPVRLCSARSLQYFQYFLLIRLHRPSPEILSPSQ